MTTYTKNGYSGHKGVGSLIFGAAVLIMTSAYLTLSQDVSSSDPDFPSQLSTPLTRKLLWVDFDGLRADFARDPKVMPTLAGLAARGASGIAETSSITLSLPAIKAWTTGQGLSARDMVANFWRIDQGTDSIFQQAYRTHLSMAYSGSPEWEDSFHQYFQDSFAHNAERNTARNDEQTQRNALRFAAEGEYNVLLVHYVNGDMTAHLYGAKDGHYANALRQIDSYIGDLINLVGEDATVLIASDHGVTDEGYHSTPTPDVVQAPFVLAGNGVKRGSEVRIKNVDIASTVAALLGVGFPSQSEGSIASAVLEAPPDQIAKWEIGYAAVRLRSLERRSSETSDVRAEFASAEAALEAGDASRAISLSRNVQRKSTAALLQLSARRSRMIMAAGVVLGFGACLLAIFTLLLSRTTMIGGASVAALGLIWWLAIHFQDDLAGMWVPFRSSVLLSHKGVVFSVIFGTSLVIAVLTRHARIPSLTLGTWIVLVVAAGGFLSSFNQVHDIVYWTGTLAIAVFLWKLALGSRLYWLDTGLYGALFIYSIIARRINTLTFWYETRMGLWVSAVAFLCLFLTFGMLVYLIYYRREFADGTPTRRFRIGLVPKPAWFLLAVGVTAQIARFRDWRSADVALIGLAGLGLLWALLSRDRTRQSTLLAAFLMILAAFPVLYPAGYFPVIGLAIVACAVSVKRMAEDDPKEGVIAAFGVAACLFLFFALSGDMNLVVIDVKRNQLLDPEFAFSYILIARVALLLILQLLLPVLVVCLWLAYGMRAYRNAWVRANILVHLFFLVQLVSLVVYLQLKRNGLNSLFETLSQLILVFALYLSFYISASVASRLVGSPEAAKPPLTDRTPAIAGSASPRFVGARD